MIEIVAGISRNGFMDFDGVLFSEKDRDRVREIMKDKIVVCGRITHEHAMEQRKNKPFDCRLVIVLTRSYYGAPFCKIASSYDEAINMAGKEEVVVLGGRNVYAEALKSPETTIVHISEFDMDYDGKLKFPELDLSYWRLSESKLHPGNPSVEFKTYMRGCPLCIKHRQKFFRQPYQEETLLDFFHYRRKVIAAYKRGHVENPPEGEEEKICEELEGFKVWIRFEHRNEQLTTKKLPGFEHLHFVFE